MAVHSLTAGGNYIHYLFYLLGTLCIAVIGNSVIKLTTLVRRYVNESTYLKHFPGPVPHWLFGNLGELPPGKSFINRANLAKKYGPVYKFQVGPYLRQVILSDPECIKMILNNADPKDQFAYGILKPWLGDGLLISQGKKWARNRRLLTPSFHFDILKPYQTIFCNSANVMMKKWMKSLKINPEESVEMFESVSIMTLDSLMKCIFGIDQDFQEEMREHPYIQAVIEISELISLRIRNLMHFNSVLYYFSSNGRKFRNAVKYVQAFSKSLIDSKRKEKIRTGNNTSTRKYVDFLDTLLDCRDDEGHGMTDQEIQDEVDTFLFEGHDTTASGLSWCLYNLARHPQYQQRCRDEINVVIGDRDAVHWDDTAKLPYLTMCIKESMRMYNPVVIISRNITNPITFPDGRSLPAGARVGIDINTCHHNPDIWPNPETYDPDRFLPENSKGRHSHAFVGFSAGPRNCIGQHFAMNEMKTVMALVLKNFYLEVDTTIPVDPYQTILLRATNGIWLKLKPVHK